MPTAKGMGSAYGGQWKPNPNKPNDMAFIGQPNTVQRIYIPTSRGGYWIQVKYGDDGWALVIRHETDHGKNNEHTNPHDHYMVYDPHTHRPLWGDSPKNNYPDGAPEFKKKQEGNTMIDWSHYDGIITNLVYDEEALRFKTIAEFKDSLINGGEIVIEWNGVEYGIFRDRRVKERYYIGCATQESNVYYDSPDELLEHTVGENRLRDVITKATVIDRFL